MRLSDENLRGRTVIASDGRAIGEVSALFFGSDLREVEAVRVRLRKDVATRLGASRGMFHAGTVEVPIDMVQSVGDAVILAVPLDDLRRVLPGSEQGDRGEQPPAH